MRKLDAGSIRKCWPMPQCVGRLSPCLLTLFRSFTEKRRPPFYLTVTNSVSEMIQWVDGQLACRRSKIQPSRAESSGIWASNDSRHVNYLVFVKMHQRLHISLRIFCVVTVGNSNQMWSRCCVFIDGDLKGDQKSIWFDFYLQLQCCLFLKFDNHSFFFSCSSFVT